LKIRIEFANQSITVFFGSRGKMRNERLNQFATCTAEGFGATEVRSVGFNEIWFEIVLADQEAELIPKAGLPVAGTIGGVRPV
jgi:hypothetical protein